VALTEPGREAGVSVVPYSSRPVVYKGMAMLRFLSKVKPHIVPYSSIS
jgi:hypothetical protein